MNWSVYMILCSDGSLYTGISTDVPRRFQQHLLGKGAKYFRGRLPVRLVFQENGHCQASATQRELAIKKMKKQDKANLFLSSQPEV